MNLEPCAHWGRTPPCTDAILAAGIRRVVYAIGDPDARVRGRGARILRRAGIQVERGLMAAEARVLNAGYLHWKETGRPRVTVKLAMSLDGRIADGRGRSRWITGAASRGVVHRMRRETDLVLVGRGTLEADDPALDVRLARGAANPLRMVTDSRLASDPGLRFFDPSGAARTLVATTRRAAGTRVRRLEERGIRVWRLAANGDGSVDLGALMRRAGREGVSTVLVEGGATLASAFLARGLADEVVLFYGPLLLGGGAKAALGDVGVRGLAGATRFATGRWRVADGDAVFTGEPLRAKPPRGGAARSGTRRAPARHARGR